VCVCVCYMCVFVCIRIRITCTEAEYGEIKGFMRKVTRVCERGGGCEYALMCIYLYIYIRASVGSSFFFVYTHFVFCTFTRMNRSRLS